jgi:hypothetical protein
VRRGKPGFSGFPRRHGSRVRLRRLGDPLVESPERPENEGTKGKAQMHHRGETALIDALVDLRELDAIRIAAGMLRTGMTIGVVEDICSEAMQAIGRGFVPCPECIEEVVTADHIADKIVNLEILARFETEPALAPSAKRL